MSARSSWTRCFTTRWAASLVCLAALSLAGGAQAAPKAHQSPAPEDIPRKVLVLYDSKISGNQDDNIVFRGFQMVFDYYGLVTSYRDIRTPGLPDDAVMRDYCAVVTTLGSDSLDRPRPYLPWLLHQVKTGRRLLILQNLGVEAQRRVDFDEAARLSEAVFAELGVAAASMQGLDRTAFRYGRAASGLMGYERPLPVQAVVGGIFEPRSTALKVYQSVVHPARPGKEFPVVFTGPGGGYAGERQIYWQDQRDYRSKWYLNPFAFAEDSLGLKDRIAPDVTTLNGMRVAFSHVDADGFAGTSRVDGKSLCAEMLRDQVVKRVNFPITLSLIVADVDPKIAANPTLAKKAQAVARELFAMPNVEPGSHTYSHPFYWNATGSTKDDYENRFPYTIPGYTFNEAMEIDGSMRFISSLSPANKPCRVLQWSGDCEPTGGQVARVDALGMLNINGGDTLYDSKHDSVTSVSPMFRVVGGRYQIFTAAANENVMTNLWKGPYHGYRLIIQTFERTESPRRLKPINAYYHFFSAEYPASLKAVQDVYAWITAQPVAPVFTSQYLEMARDYLKVRLRRAGPSVYHIENYGRCLTVRLRADAPEPNLERSENVLGYSRQKQGLYVSLAPGATRAVLSLEPRDAKVRPRVYLREAPGFVSDFHPGHDSVHLSYQGFGAGRVRLGGFTPGIAVKAAGTAMGAAASLKADAEGVVLVPGVRTGRLEVGP